MAMFHLIAQWLKECVTFVRALYKLVDGCNFTNKNKETKEQIDDQTSGQRIIVIPSAWRKTDKIMAMRSKLQKYSQTETRRKNKVSGTTGNMTGADVQQEKIIKKKF